ncbi:MAG: carbohydrate porin [Planctomycetota bacterium]
MVRPFRSLIVLTCCLIVAIARGTAAQDKPADSPAPTSQTQGPPPKPAAEAHAPTSKPFDLRTTPTLTGDWGGLRTTLEEKGFKVNWKLVNQAMVNMHGGAETTNGHDFGGSYDLDLLFDFEKMGLLQGAGLFIRGKGTWGGGANDFDKAKIGGLYKTNADVGAPESILIDKWWWTQSLFGKKVELRLGRLEPTKDLFDTSTVMGDEDRWFLNQILVRNPTIPTNKGLGAYANWKITDSVYVRAAGTNAEPNTVETDFHSAFHDDARFRAHGEVGFDPKWPGAKGELRGHYRVGGWFDPTLKANFLKPREAARGKRYDNADGGWYVGVDQMVWKENDDPKDQQGLSVAARYGGANGTVNKIDNFWSAAVQYAGPAPTRNKDLIGFGIAQGMLSDEYRWTHALADRETAYELYYSYEVAPWLIISPTFQFIHQPGGDEDDRNATVGGIRVRMAI